MNGPNHYLPYFPSLINPCTCRDQIHEGFMKRYYNVLCRVGDEKSVVQQYLRKLYYHVRKNTKLAISPEKCMTISKRLRVPQINNSYVHGQKWRWSHLTEPSYANMKMVLNPKKHCVSDEVNEICLNPNHYKGRPERVDDIAVKVEPWASVSYYEKSKKLATHLVDSSSLQIRFNSSSPVDGTPVFNLEQVANEERDWSIINTRQQIGEGILLHYISGQIFIELVSDSDLFINSKFRNFLRGAQPSTICKISPFGCNLIKVMCDDHFHKIMEDQVQKDPANLYKISQLCTVRMSFVDAWNSDASILDSPCWIEIRIVKHLKWLQNALEDIGASYKLYI